MSTNGVKKLIKSDINSLCTKMNEDTEAIYSNLGIAEIFLWISAILSAFFAAFFSILVGLTYYGMFTYLESPIIAIIGIIGFIFFGPSLDIALIVGRMKRSIRKRDIAGLKALNSRAIYVTALFLAGIIPGVILLYLHKKIDSMDSDVFRTDSADKMQGLIRMYKEELISKDEFLERKRELLENFDPVEFDVNNLRKINDMYKSGKISEDEFTELKKKVLSKY